MYNNTIKEWSEKDRPREKFIRKGAVALSDTELLAVLIRSGTQDRSALIVARDVLALADDNLSLLSKLQMKDLLTVKGMGSAKAIGVMSALELGRRRRLSEAEDKSIITISADVFNLMKPLMEDLQTEQFWVLYLNNANKVLAKQKNSDGGMTATIVDVRLVLKRALEVNATALILCHNHPSGVAIPSRADVSLTDKIKKAAQCMDIQVLDHLIITDQSYFSFADEGRM
ncbi:MAG: DNA repair protein RadC [Flavobacteriales bacterium]|nr:DNA repair protein RadC [Flavobacteriales bacterium]